MSYDRNRQDVCLEKVDLNIKDLFKCLGNMYKTRVCSL